jgi:hypothetical protein
MIGNPRAGVNVRARPGARAYNVRSLDQTWEPETR